MRFVVSPDVGEVDALLVGAAQAEHLLVLGHGAGAGMRHAWMESVCGQLALRKIATFRYQFPYTQRGERRPDPGPVLRATVRAAVDAAARAAPDLSLLAGGKSMGGRMTSLAFADSPLSGVRGLVFFGFPLHPAGAPSTQRADHLAGVSVPMLFLQGTRDRLAEIGLLRTVTGRLGGIATVHEFEGADHSFHVPKRSGLTDDEVLARIAEHVRAWASSLG